MRWSSESVAHHDHHEHAMSMLHVHVLTCVFMLHQSVRDFAHMPNSRRG